MKTVTMRLVGSTLIVQFRLDNLVKDTKSYEGMSMGFRFDVCNWLEGEL